MTEPPAAKPTGRLTLLVVRGLIIVMGLVIAWGVGSLVVSRLPSAPHAAARP